MPSTIPYDPSLVLGNIVHQSHLEKVLQIAKLQAPADAAQSTLNSLISLKRSIDMTVQEMVDMGIDPSDLVGEEHDVNERVKAAALDYGRAKLKAELEIQPIRAELAAVGSDIESPLDYNRSALRTLGIASDSMQLNVQYFSFDENAESSNSHASTISSFVSESVGIFGNHHAAQVSGSVQKQVNSQVSNHSIAGTLVIAITCTHRNAQVYAPFILDVDKSVRVWNALFPSDMLKTTDAASVAKTMAEAETKAENSFNILSGATFGSSFVGMVHVLRSESTVSNQTMQSIAASMQTSFEVGGWFADITGGFGVNSSFSDSAKSLLSVQNIQSHCSLVTMGVIPSIKANEVQLGVKKLLDSDPASEMSKLAALQGATSSEIQTLSSSAEAARTGEKMISMKNAAIQSALTGLAEIEDGKNQIIDVNSMMTAMDNYVTMASEKDAVLGVPVNYYLKPITKSMIARAWLAKYFPNRYNRAGAADDNPQQEQID